MYARSMYRYHVLKVPRTWISKAPMNKIESQVSMLKCLKFWMKM